MRVGIGHVHHVFDPGRGLVLGGLKVPGTWGLRGRGDADVVLLAIVDALLGAAALGDLEDHFPLDEDAWKDAASAVLLVEAIARARSRGYDVENVDATILAERLDLGSLRGPMRERVAELLGVDADRVNLKGARPGAVAAAGPGAGVAAIAVVSLATRNGSAS